MRTDCDVRLLERLTKAVTVRVNGRIEYITCVSWTAGYVEAVRLHEQCYASRSSVRRRTRW